MSASLVCSCLPTCFPSCLPTNLRSGMLCQPSSHLILSFTCCIRLAGLACGLDCQFVSHLALSFTLAGMLCPPRWPLSGLVSQLVWGALSAFLVLSFSFLWFCLRAFVLVLSRSLSFIWDAGSAPPGLVFFLSLVLFPSLSPIWSGMLCSPSWLVSQPSLSPVFCPILFSS